MLGLVLGVLYYFVIVLESLKDKKKKWWRCLRTKQCELIEHGEVK